MHTQVKIEPSWKKELHHEFEKEYFQSLSKFVRAEYLSTPVYPKPQSVFRAFDLCPFDNVEVVIVGQDPYHGKGQANGLSFAVDAEMRIPPSLQNIFKEIQQDLSIDPEQSGDLTRWACQGVLMLNAVLTVRAGSPASHKGRGWEEFTDAVITELNQSKKNIVYMLWGKYAQEKGLTIDRENNLVLTSGHPSPYSAKLFHGNHHFSKCNEYLKEHGKKPIDWK
ncbi:uracil-DNA glycosylase [Candidatus Woesebacteria bacterium]|nr:uracil-DNA glycosylase [Candidatus Woesebacteria bacterium]